LGIHADLYVVKTAKKKYAKYAKWLTNNQYVIEKCPKLLEALKNI
jgi:hypothetical protein